MQCHRPLRVVPMLMAVAFVAAGCKSDPFMDGRFWRQPPEKKPGLRGMTPLVGISGYSTDASVGPGFSTSGGFFERGGANTGRYGSTAIADRSINRTVAVGSAGGTMSSAVTSDQLKTPGVNGGTMRSAGYTEGSTRVGTTP